jgi:hypothetical protein
MANTQMTHHEAFIYKLNAMEAAASAENPAKEGYAAKREQVIRHVDALETRLLAAERDAARFVWYFDWTTKGENFIAAYMQGMREHWTLEQWRAAIDKAMSLAGKQEEP